jgi:diaminopimelate epimerase
VADIDGAPPRAYKVGTLAGLIQPEVRADGQVAVDMGEPVLNPADVPCTLAATQDGTAVGLSTCHHVILQSKQQLMTANW